MKKTSQDKILDIPIKDIDDFPDHPYKIRDDEDMEALVESIGERGVITPALVRKKEDGRYELIAGHRRKRAIEILGLDKLRCEVKDVTPEEATILMVESNFQRSDILPSEKAFAYKMRYDAMKKDIGRPSKKTVPVGQVYEEGATREILSSYSKDSSTQIQRYIRLTYLLPLLLDLVDEGRIKIRPAVELSYLGSTVQRSVYNAIQRTDATPSHAQAIRIRELYKQGELTGTKILRIMEEEKGNQKEKVVFRGDRVLNLFPKDLTPAEREDYVCKALEHYNKYMKLRKERSR